MSTRQQDLSNVVVDSRVTLTDGRTGVVKFVGPVHFRPGVIAGILLDPKHTDGTSDGSVNGWRYFEAPPNRAVFVKRAELIVLEDDESPEPSPPPTRNMMIREVVEESYPEEYITTRETRYSPSPEIENVLITEGETFMEEDDDKYRRWARGMVAAIRHDYDYDPNPNNTTVETYYALVGAPHEDLAKIRKSKYRKCLASSLPQDIDEKGMKIDFEDLGDYTEMKVRYEANTPEEADDLKWTMLDPVQVRKFNDQMADDPDVEVAIAKYAYLKRRDVSDCCTWVKPCIACICCWLLLLTLLLGMLFNKMYNLANDVEDLKENGGGSGGVTRCNGEKICDILDRLGKREAGLEDEVKGIEGPGYPGPGSGNGAPSVKGNADAIDDLKKKVAGGLGDIQYETQKTFFGNSDKQTAKCSGPSWQMMNCWVSLPGAGEAEWQYFTTQVDLVENAPDCTCYCEHLADSTSCKKASAQCNVRCIKQEKAKS